MFLDENGVSGAENVWYWTTKWTKEEGEELFSGDLKENPYKMTDFFIDDLDLDGLNAMLKEGECNG